MYQLDMGFRYWYCLNMGSTDRYCLDMGSRYVHVIQTTTAHLQTVPHLYSPCPLCTLSLQPMSSLYSIFTHMFRGQHTYKQYAISAACPVSTQSLLSMSSQHTASPANIHVNNHLYYPYLVRAPYHLHMANHSCWCPVTEPCHLTMSSL